jgi:protein associated with RNAse G/E
MSELSDANCLHTEFIGRYIDVYREIYLKVVTDNQKAEDNLDAFNKNLSDNFLNYIKNSLFTKIFNDQEKQINILKNFKEHTTNVVLSTETRESVHKKIKEEVAFSTRLLVAAQQCNTIPDTDLYASFECNSSCEVKYEIHNESHVNEHHSTSSLRITRRLPLKPFVTINIHKKRTRSPISSTLTLSDAITRINSNMQTLILLKEELQQNESRYYGFDVTKTLMEVEKNLVLYSCYDYNNMSLDNLNIVCENLSLTTHKLETDKNNLKFIGTTSSPSTNFSTEETSSTIPLTLIGIVCMLGIFIGCYCYDKTLPSSPKGL